VIGAPRSKNGPASSPARIAGCLAAMMCAAALLVVAVPTPALAAPAPPALGVRSATLVVEGSNQRLYGVNPGAEVAIASTTKLMTALETLEHARMNTVFTYPAYSLSSQDSQIGLVPGERMTVSDLLLAMMLPSADDAAYDLAYNIGHGSVPRFVAMMNADARRLGLTETHYSTPVGLDTPGNYSSASDLVMLAGYLLQHYPLFAHDVGLTSAVLHSGSHPRGVVNLNDLVGRVPWIHGVKTGHTLDAGYCLVGVGTQNGMTLVSAVLGTASEAARDANTLALLNWGFANFRLAKPVDAGDIVARPTVADRPGFRAGVIAGASFADVIPRSARLHTSLTMPHQLTGPLKRHARVGTLLVLDGRKVVGRVPLLLVRALPAVSPVTIAARFLTRTSTLLVLVVVLGGMGVLVHRRRGQRVARSTPA
jgi:D-alanyl-D-alanine carboxypeptidase (penicillin-binding protein 5/6)